MDHLLIAIEDSSDNTPKVVLEVEKLGSTSESTHSIEFWCESYTVDEKQSSINWSTLFAIIRVDEHKIRVYSINYQRLKVFSGVPA